MGEIGVKNRLMLDQRQRFGRADQRRSEIAETVTAVAAPRGESKRVRRLQEASRRLGFEPELRRERLDALRSGAKLIEELQLHAGEKRLRISKARAKIEHRLGAPPCVEARERVREETRAKFRIGELAVAPTAQAFEK